MQQFANKRTAISFACLSAILFLAVSLSGSTGPRNFVPSSPANESLENLCDSIGLDTSDDLSVKFHPQSILKSFFPVVALETTRMGPSFLGLVSKHFLIEAGVLVFLQTLGIPLLASLASMIRRIKVVPVQKLSNAISRPLLQIALRRSSKFWYGFGKFYKKTSLSKFVNRSKKLIKIIQAKKEHKHDS